MSAPEWKITGEFIAACSCDVFCPCVISLGRQRPTYGYCHGFMGFLIDKGFYGSETLDGLRAALLVDIPGAMHNGNWTVGIYLDERANDTTAEGLKSIMSGQAGGSTSLFQMLFGHVLGIKRVAIDYKAEGKARTIQIGKKLVASIRPTRGADPKRDLVVTNTEYWISPDIVVCEAERAKIRDWGRVWDFDGQSAEICKIDWRGP